MLLKVDSRNRIGEHVAMRAMFEARKRVFIDLLKWDIPALDGRFEVDQFDGGDALYLILTDSDRRHLASARLLPTTQPGILNSLYQDLCEGCLPEGADTYEITRFCLSPDLHAADRRACRDTLIIALARFALDQGIATYVGVAERAWLDQILALGWDCSLLGPPKTIGGRTLGAMRIDVREDSVTALEAAGLRAIDEPFIPARRAA